MKIHKNRNAAGFELVFVNEAAVLNQNINEAEEIQQKLHLQANELKCRKIYNRNNLIEKINLSLVRL